MRLPAGAWQIRGPIHIVGGMTLAGAAPASWSADPALPLRCEGAPEACGAEIEIEGATRRS